MNYTEIIEKMRKLGELFLDKYQEARGKKSWKHDTLNRITFYCSSDDEYEFDNGLVIFKVNTIEIQKMIERVDIIHHLNDSNSSNDRVDIKGVLEKIEDCLKTNTNFPESMDEFLLDTNVEPDNYKQVSTKADILDKLLERDIKIEQYRD